MNNSEKKLTEKELKLIEETEAFMEEVYGDSDVADAEPPVDLHDKVFAEIRAREAAKREAQLKVEKLDVEEEEAKVEKLNEEEAKAEKFSAEEKEPEAEKLTAEEKELIYLGRIYKKRRKLQKYMVLAAVLIMALAFGITSIGGPEKIFEMVKSTLMGREQINVDSDNISRTAGMSEEEAYQKIEEKFGFVPVGLGYLPEDVIFLESTINVDTQCINLVYGKNEEVVVGYFIRPNFRLSSYGKDVEDEFVEEYTKENEHTTFYIRKYLVEGIEERWSVQFEYCDVSYSLTIYDMPKGDVNQIVESLFFS